MILKDELTYERVGQTWVFSDGTVIPVVSGGSDAGTLGDGAAGGDPAATATDPAAAGGTGADAEPSGENWDEGTKTYIDKLRNEAAGYRTRAKEYEDVFGGIDPEDRKVWLGMAREVYANPKAGAEWMAKVAQGVLSGMSQEAAEAAAGSEPTPKPEGAEDPADKPMTRKEMEEFLAQREATKEQERLIQNITDEAVKLGYTDGTPEFNNLLWLGAHQTGGDLQKAHEMMEASKQAVIDAYLEQKRNETGSLTNPGGLPGQQAPTQIKSLDDAHKAAKARIEGVLGARR